MKPMSAGVEMILKFMADKGGVRYGGWRYEAVRMLLLGYTLEEVTQEFPNNDVETCVSSTAEGLCVILEEALAAAKALPRQKS